MDTKHTPGQWHWVNAETDEPLTNLDVASCSRASLRTVEERQSKHIPSTLPAFILDVDEMGDGWSRTAEEVAANARLIAASPSMYALLSDFVENDTTPEPNFSCHIAPPCGDCVEYSGQRGLIAAARALLAKIDGRE